MESFFFCQACRDHVEGSRQTRGEFFAKPVETTSKEVDSHVESFCQASKDHVKGSRQTRGEFIAKPVETTSNEVDRHVDVFLPSLWRPRQGRPTDTWRVFCQACGDHVKGSRQTRGEFFLPSLWKPRQRKSTDTWRVFCQACRDHVKGSRQTRGEFFAKPVETTSREVDRHVEGFFAKPLKTTSKEVDRHVESFFCQACRDHVKGSRQTGGEFLPSLQRPRQKKSTDTWRVFFFAKPAETKSKEVDRHVEVFLPSLWRPRQGRSTDTWRVFLPSLRRPRQGRSTDTWRVFCQTTSREVDFCQACTDHAKGGRQTHGEFFAKPRRRKSTDTCGGFFAKPVETTSKEVDRHVESFFAKPVETTSKEVDRHVESLLPSLGRPRQGKSTDTWRVCSQACRDHVKGSRQTCGVFFCQAGRDHVKGSRQTRGEFFAKPVETTSREVDRHVESFLPSLWRPRQKKSTDTWRVCCQACRDQVKGSRQTRGEFFAEPVETTSKEVDRHVESFLPSL